MLISRYGTLSDLWGIQCGWAAMDPNDPGGTSPASSSDVHQLPTSVVAVSGPTSLPDANGLGSNNCAMTSAVTTVRQLLGAVVDVAAHGHTLRNTSYIHSV